MTICLKTFQTSVGCKTERTKKNSHVSRPTTYLEEVTRNYGWGWMKQLIYVHKQNKME